MTDPLVSAITVEGVVVRGHGVASGASLRSPYPAGTITLQAPYFSARGLDLSGLYPATLNVDIAPHTFEIGRPAHTFRDVRWTDLHGPETFSFITCRLTPLPSNLTSESCAHGKRIDGWVYYPHPETKPMHEQPATVLEVLMPYLPGLDYGDRLRLSLDPREIRIT